MRAYRALRAAIAACSALLVASCSNSVLDGHAIAMLYAPDRAGGLPAVDGPSGTRSTAPHPTGTIRNTDNGAMDHLVLLGLNDIEGFWRQNYSATFQGNFQPISDYLSYDSKDPNGPEVCGHGTYKLVNALYCQPEDVMAWDRTVLLPVGKQYFGEMSVIAVLAHEYGHAVQWMAKLINRSTPILVREQQADCFSGVYMRFVAGGQSQRFTLSTTDGLSHVLAGALVLRDPTLTPADTNLLRQGHGSAIDRIGAFQIGFDDGAAGCAKIDMTEINQRRGDLPMVLQVDTGGNPQATDISIDNDTLTTLMELLGQIFKPANAPTLSTNTNTCSTGQQAKPAAYCPASNTIAIDLPSLQQMGSPADESQLVLLQGDDTALSVVTSRYVLAVEKEKGAPLDTATAALRTACLTGVAQRKMAEPIQLPSGKSLVLTAGDVDKAVSGLLTNGQVASDVNGKIVPAAFTRILAFRSGLEGNPDLCFQRFS